ncbi:acetyltransferase [Actinoplanes bogorensis]|uniref:Acetyltransferase n=1 Tax=Paractinoplanes bogorensis TaxID=1610840 RepID=A0ABS5YNP3_9ACTN|nr:acetyltransferase [Actinoplanes bogorensis]MBU2665087.1 acetyltransferase [Actinoplanes bogorensis]
MSSLVFRPLVPGEESVFDSFPGRPSPMPFADGLAAGGFAFSRTWIALRDGAPVARAAWVLPPGSVGGPWLEVFDLNDSPEVGAALLRRAHDTFGDARPYYAVLPVDPRVAAAARLAGLIPTVERLRFRWTPTRSPVAHTSADVRLATGPDEVRALIARLDTPDVLTGSETAWAVAGIDLARDPMPWLTGPAAAWHVLHDDGRPVGLAGTAGEACWPMIVYLGIADGDSCTGRMDLLVAALRALVAGGAEEVVADVESTFAATIEDLRRAGFEQIRARLAFEPRDGSGTQG